MNDTGHDSERYLKTYTKDTPKHVPLRYYILLSPTLFKVFTSKDSRVLVVNLVTDLMKLRNLVKKKKLGVRLTP